MFKKGLRFLRSNSVGVLALFVALGGTSYAATGGFTSGGKLQACVGEGGGLTLLKSGKHCKRGQQTVAWNQTGPKGAAGANGASGAPGSTGATGSAGQPGAPGAPAVTLWARVSETGEVLAGSGVVSASGEGFYEVRFNRDITRCGVSGSLNLGSAKTIHAVLTGAASPTKVEVITTNATTFAANEFTLFVTC